MGSRRRKKKNQAIQHSPANHDRATVSVDNLPESTGFIRYAVDDGEKFVGGFGATELLEPDYWTLRARSAQLFEKNHYARGLIRRIVDNTIATGLNLEAIPDEKILGLSEDEKTSWSENVETRFQLWARTPSLCDASGRRTFGELQADAFREADVDGDVLVTLSWNKLHRLPRVGLIKGSAVQTPFDGKPRGNNEIDNGVEVDSLGRYVAFWVRQKDGTFKRLPAFGEKSGRRLAWLVYSGDRRIDEVRGKPRLALVLQSLREIDRYRDSTQRKASINAMLAAAIERDVNTQQISRVTGRAQRAGSGTIDVQTGQGDQRKFRIESVHPGSVVEHLQPGEKFKPYPTTGTDERFGAFELAILKSIAWSNGVSPEILLMEFNKSFSAASASNNEFAVGVTRRRVEFGGAFNFPIYEEWLTSEVLNGKISAPGFLEAYRDPQQYDVYNAWLGCDWAGQVKPAVDPVKVANGYTMLIREGLITRDRAAREINGSKYDDNVKRLAIENIRLADAIRPIVELEAWVPPRQEPPPDDDEDEDDDEEDAEAQASERRRLSVVS